MTDQNAIPVAKRPRARKRRFYEIGPNFALGGGLGFCLEDRSVLPPHGVSRLPASTPPVSCVFDKSVGKLPCDIELCSAWWLVSERTKALFERLDPEAFVFVPCEVRMRRGQYDGPKFWLCDVVRVLDALDESQSRLRMGIRDDISFLDHGRKYYEFLAFGGKLVFREICSYFPYGTQGIDLHMRPRVQRRLQVRGPQEN